MYKAFQLSENCMTASPLALKEFRNLSKIPGLACIKMYNIVHYNLLFPQLWPIDSQNGPF